MLLILLIGLAVLIADQISKLLICGFISPSGEMLIDGLLTFRGESVEVIPKTLSFTYVLNNGAAFGILQNQRLFFLIVTVAVCAVGIIFLMRMQKKHILVKLSSGFILGGALGNLVDRSIIGVVRDFFDLTLLDTLFSYKFPVFNTADIFVVVGVIILSVYILFIHDKYIKKNENTSGK